MSGVRFGLLYVCCYQLSYHFHLYFALIVLIILSLISAYILPCQLFLSLISAYLLPCYCLPSLLITHFCLCSLLLVSSLLVAHFCLHSLLLVLSICYLAYGYSTRSYSLFIYLLPPLAVLTIYCCLCLCATQYLWLFFTIHIAP